MAAFLGLTGECFQEVGRRPVMMLAYRLVRLIETHSDTLASSLLRKVQNSGFTLAYSKVPPVELKQRVYEIYGHLGDWLLGRSEADIEKRYLQIGSRRAQQGVPQSQVTWAIVLTKENLWQFIRRELPAEHAVEIFGELELLQLLEQFFDRAIYYSALGHERALAEMAMPTVRRGRKVACMKEDEWRGNAATPAS
jgi:hypothetical protein